MSTEMACRQGVESSFSKTKCQLVYVTYRLHLLPRLLKEVALVQGPSYPL